MKTLILAVTSALFILQAEAAEPEFRVISNRHVVLNVEISADQIRLSKSGYSMPVVKILVPDLADVTLLDHRNASEKAPCMATYQAQLPEQIVQNNPAKEQAKMKVTLIKQALVNDETKLCDIFLTETITGKIRGFEFRHSVTKNIATRAIDDCR